MTTFKSTNMFAALLLVGIAACASAVEPMAAAPPQGQKSTSAVAARAQIVPLTDHHQHVFGEALIDPPTKLLPEVVLPPSLRAAVRKRERISGTGEIGNLYANNAIVLNIFWDTDYWVTGRAAIGAVVEGHGTGLRFVPNSFAIDKNVAVVAGVAFADEEGEYDKHFIIAFEKQKGAWRIVSESITDKVRNPFRTPVDAKTLIMRLDEAGIERATVLSTAFWLDGRLRSKPVAEQAAATRAANDWVIEQTGRYPGRLVPFCSVSPLAPFAIEELNRCAANSRVRGMKLHFNNNKIDLKRADHLARVQAFFRAADSKGLAIVVHLWPKGGAEYSRIFLEQVLPQSPHIPVQIAHVGSGAGDQWDDVLAVYSQALANRDPRAANLYIDVADWVREDTAEADVERLAVLLRQAGFGRILYGSDTPIVGQRPMPLQQWATFKRRMPLTDAELRDIADNVAPYLAN
ncbi:MAG TPA: amidohydrolase family protein [Sphingomicrobium sp.]|jgi:predicted TIM-barrel fold metal-dependent hydrolase